MHFKNNVELIAHFVCCNFVALLSIRRLHSIQIFRPTEAAERKHVAHHITKPFSPYTFIECPSRPTRPHIYIHIFIRIIRLALNNIKLCAYGAYGAYLKCVFFAGIFQPKRPANRKRCWHLLGAPKSAANKHMRHDHDDTYKAPQCPPNLALNDGLANFNQYNTVKKVVLCRFCFCCPCLCVQLMSSIVCFYCI